MIHRLSLHLAWPAMLLAAAGLTSNPAWADEVPCPLTGARWGVIDHLPDPLHDLAGDRPAQLRVQESYVVNGKQYLRCAYSRVQGPGEGVRLDVELRQPKITGVPVAQHFCPPAVRIAIKDPLPQHWTARTYTLARQFRLLAPGGHEVRCGYWQEGAWPGGRPFDLERPVRTEYGTLGAAPPPPPPGLPLTNAFAVTRAHCQVDAPAQPVDCPATIRAQCSVTTNGPGQVAVKFVHNARAEPARTVGFAAAGSQRIAAEFVAGAPGPAPAPTGGLVAPSQPGHADGSVRLLVLAPEAGIDGSNVAPYSVTCRRSSGPAGLGLAHGAPGPAPGSPAASATTRRSAPSASDHAAERARDATSSTVWLDGFVGGVRVAADLEPPAWEALSRSGGAGVFAVWLTAGAFPAVEKQPRLRRLLVLHASNSARRTVLFDVEFVGADPAGQTSRSHRRRFLVRYQRVETEADPGLR